MTRMHRLNIEGVRRRIGMRDKMSDRVDLKVLKWLGHTERMRGERLSKRMYEPDVEGLGVKDRTYMG